MQHTIIKSKIKNRFQKLVSKNFGWGRLNKVYFISFPKSGRTWARIFLNYYYFTLYPFALLDWKDTKLNKKIPHLKFSHTGYNERNEKKVIRNFAKKIENNKKIFMVRDPRDIFVSYFFQLTKRKDPAQISSNIDWSSITMDEMIKNEQYGIHKIISFLNEWLMMLNKNKNLFILFYEDLQEKPVENFKELLLFLGEKKINVEAFQLAIDSSSLSQMKKREEKGVHSLFELSPNDKKDPDSYKTRKGKIGGYLDYMSEENIFFCKKEIERLNHTLKKYKNY